MTPMFFDGFFRRRIILSRARARAVEHLVAEGLNGKSVSSDDAIKLVSQVKDEDIETKAAKPMAVLENSPSFGSGLIVSDIEGFLNWIWSNLPQIEEVAQIIISFISIASQIGV
jgi:hypothetical protein